MSILVVIIIIFVLSLFNFISANEKTYHDRINLITYIYLSKNWFKMYTILDDITYTKHLLMVMFFINPWKLYPKSLFDEGFDPNFEYVSDMRRKHETP